MFCKVPLVLPPNLSANFLLDSAFVYSVTVVRISPLVLCVLFFIGFGLVATFPYPDTYTDRPVPGLDCEPRLVGWDDDGDEIYRGWECIQMDPSLYPDMPVRFVTSEYPMIRGSGSPDYTAFLVVGFIGLVVLAAVVGLGRRTQAPRRRSRLFS